MYNLRVLPLLTSVIVLVVSSMLCSGLGTSESDDLLEAQNMTGVAVEATRFARDITATAQASITPTTTPVPTSTGLPEPTNTPVPTELPVALFAATDLAGDSFLCDSGAGVDDPAVDIHSVMVYDPPVWGSDYPGWLVRVELGAPANVTFANDWSASLLGAFAAQGATAYTLAVNEVHAGETTIGIFDQDFQNILPDTEDRITIDEQGNIWFQIPRDTSFMRFASFHTPTDDLPPEQKRCDLAPDDGEFRLELP